MVKIALLDAHDENYRQFYALTGPNRLDYCIRHDIEFITYNFGKLDPVERQPNWGKFQGLMHHLPNYDWIFYLDTDAILTNMEIDVRQYIDDNYDLILAPLPHEGHLSTGSFLIKNAPWSMDFMKTLWDQTQFIHEPYHGTDSGGDGMYFEQSALHFLYDTRPEYRPHIKVVERKLFCSMIADHEPDHLLVHFPGRINKFDLIKTCLAGRYADAKEESVQFDAAWRKIYDRASKPPEKVRVIGKPKL